MRRAGIALAGAAAVWLLTGTTILATSVGCYTHACDFGPVIDYATKKTDDGGARVDDQFCGEFIAPDLWESSPVDADWISFPPKTTIKVIIPNWIGEQRPFVDLRAYVSQQRHPVCTGDGCDNSSKLSEDTNNFTEGTGNIVEFSRAGPGVVWIANDTCAQFYLRVVLRGGQPVSAPTYDASTLTPGPLGPNAAVCETQ